MANEKNLIPQAHTLTVEEASKGGKKSGEVRRAKRTFREMMEQYGELPDKLNPDMTNDEAVIIAQYKIAKDHKATGSTKAAEFIRDTKGENPKTNELTLNATIETINISFGNKKVVEEE